MKLFKRSLCIFLSVMMLFFSVNNSYFSPQKMDSVEATAAAVTVTISADLIIALIVAVGVAGLSAAIINNIKDWDWNAICNDMHDWCRAHIDVLDQYVTEGSSALKEWALADEWVVIEGGGGSPEPSPSPDRDIKFSEKVWGSSDIWNIGNLIAGAGVLSAEFYNKLVPQDEGVVEIAKAYINDKISNFTAGNPLSLTDPITNTLNELFVPNDDELKYTGYIASSSFEMKSTFVNGKGEKLICSSSISGSDNEIIRPYGYVDSAGAVFLNYGVLVLNSEDTYVLKGTFTPYFSGTYYYPNGSSSSWYGKINGIYIKPYYAFGSEMSVNFPLFYANNDEIIKYLNSGDDSACINKQVTNRKYNYIDTSGDYGWASTADLSPADLLAANPGLAGDLTGKDVSIAGLVAAINALKSKLEEENPNTSADPAAPDPVPFPDNSTYPDIVKDVIKDPAIFPTSDPVTKPDPDPGMDPDPDPGTETGKDYTGLLGIIINLLKSILQAIKDFMSWFIIDFDAIKAHLLLALQNIPAFSGFDGFLAILDRIKGSISDSYEYPKITIKTPDILKQFLKTDEILLLDFKDYATYFLWVRTAMGFAILFGFFMWVVRDIKVELTLN